MVDTPLIVEARSIIASKETSTYHNLLISKVNEALKLANSARIKGYDPKKEVEIYIAQDVAARTEGLVGPEGVANRLKELEDQEEHSKDTIVIEIAKEIAQGRFVQGSPELLAEQAMRTALSYQTEGITAAPIEGIGKVKIKSNVDGTQYLAVYFSGPIRSAGGTAQGISLLIADVIRRELGLARYKATSDEIERMLEEVRLYNQIMHLQLPTSDEEIRHAWKNIPVMVTGDPTEKEEVGGYRNIESMDTNRVRGGACLVLNDGLVGRAKKITKRIKNLDIDGWGWLEDIANGRFSDKRATENSDGEQLNEVQPDYSFASDALMGRPTFSDPTALGGFRLRMGRARNTGIAGIGIHPAVMGIVNDFLATGTHIRTERPGKGSIVVPVDSITPPIVLTDNGDVLSIPTYDEGVKIRPKIKKILFLGDMLVGFGEFIQNNYHLCPVGYNEEWWEREFEEAQEKQKDNEALHFSDHESLTAEDTIQLSEKLGIPLHPRFTPCWRAASLEEVEILHRALWKVNTTFLPIETKSILEKLLIKHTAHQDGLDIGEMFQVLRLQLPQSIQIDLTASSTLSFIQSTSTVPVRDFLGTTIGARMGRPEKAKERLMKPQLHGLFPVGSDKKVGKNLAKAVEVASIRIRLGNRYCTSCNKSQFHIFCSDCTNETILLGFCSNPRCNAQMDEGPCDICGASINYTKFFEVSVSDLLDESYRRLGQIGNTNVKLKDQLSNPTGTPELLDKGILRSRSNLNVFRDGTIRYDATDAPLTHFYPR
ncbi:MAG: DNA-directed DNA polymerase II large subunit, partial [Candidatus Kariarchaeaceae archaeon]